MAVTAPGQLIVTPHPLLVEGQKNVTWVAQAGESLYSILQRNVDGLDGEKWEVSIGGRTVDRHMWHHVFPKQGNIIEVRGGVGRAALAIVALVALSYFTFGFGTATAGMWGAGAVSSAWGVAAASGIYLAGSMLINKVLGPKLPRIAAQSQDSVYSIGAARNQLRQYEPFPILFGSVRIAPDYLSKPYSWYQGNDQYVGLLLSAGINVGRIEQFYNGDTQLSSYDGVSVFHAGYTEMPDQAIPLYSNVDTVDGAALPKNQGWVQRTTSANTVRIQINLEYLLGGTGTSGKNYFVSETIESQYRVVGATNWMPLVTRQFRSDRLDVANRASLTAEVPEGQYEVRVRSMGYGNYSGANTQRNDFQWTTLSSIQADTADYTGIARTGVIIKATDQLNGAPDELRAVAHATPIPEWNGTAFVTKESSNPGAQCLAYARGIYAGTRFLAGMGLSDDQIDIESWKAFTIHCASQEYTYDFYVKDARSHEQVLAAIALAGFGHITWAGGKLGVVWAAQEQPLSGVVNMATISKGQFQVDYTLSNAADGVEFSYFDKNTWSTATLRVPAPGVTTMYNPAQISGEGVTSERHAARLARWHLAQSLYQYKDISYSTDLEHLSYQRMSLLAMQHDLTQWGYGGRILAATNNAGVVTLTLDDAVPGPTATNAYIGVRIPGERVYRVLKVKPFTGNSEVITLADPWPSGAAFPGNDPENPAHDTIWIYDFRQTPGYKVRVVGIEPESDLKGASVKVVPEGPEFWDYVLNGRYIPAPNQSLLQTRPVVSNVTIAETQIVQGNTTFTELTATFDVTGPVGDIIVLSGVTGTDQREVAQTSTRTATWRIDSPGTYNITIRPFSPGGEVGVSASVVYATRGTGLPPVLVDIFTIEEEEGGVRQYTWGWLDGTVRSPDFVGVEIRYIQGAVINPNWDQMTPLSGTDGYFTAPFETVMPPAGEWTFACRSRNSGGVLSTEKRVVTKTLGANLGEIIENLGPDDVTQKLIDLQLAIEKERLDRFNADAQEAQDRAEGLAAEALERQQQINTERAAREAAVAAERIRIDAIDDDEIISPVEKPQLRIDYSALLDERAGINAEADLSEVVDEKDAYNEALDRLITYMGTLVYPTRWDDTSGNTNLT